MVRPAAYREAVGLVTKELNLSVRRTCRALGFSRSNWHYKSRRAPQKELISRLRALASKRKRWGYRMLHTILRREGQVVNHKRVYRLYCLEGLAVRRKVRKRMARGPRVTPPLATRPNERWSMDFVSDVTSSGRRYRILVVIDEFTREVLALVIDTSFSGARVGRELDAIAVSRGLPKSIVVDNGPEFTRNSWGRGRLQPLAAATHERACDKRGLPMSHLQRDAVTARPRRETRGSTTQREAAPPLFGLTLRALEPLGNTTQTCDPATQATPGEACVNQTGALFALPGMMAPHSPRYTNTPSLFLTWDSTRSQRGSR